MRHIIFFVFISGVCSSFALLSGNPAAKGPLLIIDTTNADFGSIPNVGHTEHSFVLRNKGDEVLHITGIRPSCGCTVASLKDSVVGPGGATTLLLRLAAAHRPGGFTNEVLIVSNSRDSSAKKLWFYGRFIAASGSDTARTYTYFKHRKQ